MRLPVPLYRIFRQFSRNLTVKLCYTVLIIKTKTGGGIGLKEKKEFLTLEAFEEAYAAASYGVQATIVMPTTTPLIKVNRTKALGAEEPDYESAQTRRISSRPDPPRVGDFVVRRCL